MGTFQYSYRLGMNWPHEKLVAPFDFPILKNEGELIEGKRKLVEQLGLIYDYSLSVGEHKITDLSDDIASIKPKLTSEDSLSLISTLSNIYSKGIYIIPEDYAKRKITTLSIVRENIAKSTPISLLFTPKTAYQQLKKAVDTLAVSKVQRAQLDAIDLSRLIVPNLIWNDNKTNLAFFNASKDISLTKGMVKKGETIIRHNDPITTEKFEVLNSLKYAYRINYGNNDDIGPQVIGQFIIIVIGILIFTLYLITHKKSVFYNTKDFVFLYSLFFASVAMVLAAHYQNVNLYAVPTLLFVIVVNILIDSRTALYLMLGTSIIISFIASDNFQYIVMQIAAGIVSVYSLRQLQRRSQLFIAILFILATYVVTYIAFELTYQGTLDRSSSVNIIWLAINSLLLSLSYLTIFLFERLFGYTSELTLLELSNPNHPALRLLSKKAPGTFQHSMMVANLAEEAIHRIGGDPILVRTGALYHDIGKLSNPIYFIENQSGGRNPHDELDYDESAKIITNHVREGVDLAKKYNLPRSIIDFIKTHHGKNKVKYFYNSYKNKYPDQQIDERIFTYDGPDPITKENAVLMMADAVEATIRSLKDKSEENVQTTVNAIVDGLQKEGRFKYSQITFSDIEAVKQVFINMLIKIYHSRIAYPTLKKEEKE